MNSIGPRILLIGGTYRALCVLERLLERGERVVAFIGEEGSERDFCSEILEVCDRASIPARSGRKLGEEMVRWLEDRIRPDLAISVGISSEIPLAIGGNCRLGLVDVVDFLQRESCGGVVLRQGGQEILRRDIPAPKDEDEIGDVYLRVTEETLELLDEYMDSLGHSHGRPRTRVPFESAPLCDDDLRRLIEQPDPGAVTDRLERHVASYLGAHDVLALRSPIEAFGFVLQALGIGPGHEVLVPGLASRAAIDGVRSSGAKPVMVDVDATTLCIDCEALQDHITPRSRAVIVSHAFGQAADLERLRAIAAESGLELIEDAGAGLGDVAGVRPIGHAPSTCVFQLPLADPAANSRAALVALAPHIAPAVRRSASHRRLADGASELMLARLTHWDDVLTARRANALLFSSEFGRYDAFEIPRVAEGRSPTYASYVLRVTSYARTSADDLHKLLREAGIETRRLARLTHDRELCEIPVAERVCSSALLLPIDLPLDGPLREQLLDTIFDYAIG